MENLQASIDWLITARESFYKLTEMSLDRVKKQNSLEEAFEFYLAMIENDLIQPNREVQSTPPFSELITGRDYDSAYDDFYMERYETRTIVDVYRQMQDHASENEDIKLDAWKRAIMAEKVTHWKYDW